MIREGWFFLVVGVIAIVSAIFDKKSPMVNTVDGNVTDEDKQKYKPTTLSRLISGLIGAASAVYGWHLLQQR